MKQRIDVEWMVANQVVDDLLAAGFAVSVYDGEEFPLENSRDKAAILEAMASTDEDFLHVSRATDKIKGWVRMVYGNGMDVVSDYTTNLEPFLKGYNALWDKLAKAESKIYHDTMAADDWAAVFNNGV